MSTQDQAFIDPSLRDSNVRTPGSKRKVRNSGPQASGFSRVTRRSQAMPVGGVGGVVGLDNAILGGNSFGAEPSRGEEENLIGYEWARGNDAKRSRHHSPSSGSIANTYHANSSSAVDLSMLDWVNKDIIGQTGTSGSSLAGMDGLAAAAATFQTPSTSKTNQLRPYPYGLTPFRFTCIHPTLPNPPPGNPNNPSFKPFDPYASDPQPSTSSLKAPVQSPSNPISNSQSQITNSHQSSLKSIPDYPQTFNLPPPIPDKSSHNEIHHPSIDNSLLQSDSDGNFNFAGVTVNENEMDGETYQSLSALLSESNSVPSNGVSQSPGLGSVSAPGQQHTGLGPTIETTPGCIHKEGW